MNAVSPYSLADVQRHDRPNAVSGLASGVAKGLDGAADVANAFADIWSELDINGDARLNGGDLAGHAIAAGKEVLGAIFGTADRQLAGGTGGDTGDGALARTAQEAVSQATSGIGAIGHRLYTASGAALAESAVTPRASELAARALNGAYSEMRAVETGAQTVMQAATRAAAQSATQVGRAALG